MNIKAMQVGPIGTNCYILEDSAARQAAVIDPGGDAPRLLAALKGLSALMRNAGPGNCWNWYRSGMWGKRRSRPIPAA